MPPPRGSMPSRDTTADDAHASGFDMLCPVTKLCVKTKTCHAACASSCRSEYVHVRSGRVVSVTVNAGDDVIPGLVIATVTPGLVPPVRDDVAVIAGTSVSASVPPNATVNTWPDLVTVPPVEPMPDNARSAVCIVAAVA